MHARLVILLLLVFCLAPNGLAAGSTPRLNIILPRGVQRGHEHVLRFSGARLANAREVFLYDQGVEVIELSQVDGENVDVRIRVAPDCRPGEHVAQLRTERGISDFRSFHVGVLPELDEVEPNNSLDEAQSISLNVTINGLVTNEDVDVYRVEAQQGQRLSVEIEAMRLGFWFDPVIAVLNNEKFELAVSDDSVLHQQDGIVSFLIPEDGEYFVLVREASYGGNGNCRYRLHVGGFPRPTIVFPAGGPPDQEIDLQFLGDPSGPLPQKIMVSEAMAAQSGIFFQDASGITPSPISFRVSDLVNHLEQEPNDDHQQVQPALSVPGALNGIISQPGDQDNFRIAATKGESYDIHCYARRIRSGLDPVINIFDGNGKHIVGDDDARRPDCYLRFNIPETGEYVIRVRDHLSRGSAEFVYRIEFERVQPSLSVSIPRVDRYSQLRQQICVPQGNRFATLISASRSNFGGEIELIAEGLPEGISMDSRPMVANLNQMPVVFSATDDAPIAGKLLDLKARHVDPNLGISGRFNLLADFSLGPPNNSLYYGCSVNRLAAAVTKALPFKIKIQQPRVPLVRNGSMQLKIIATRDEGFDAPIQVQFPFRPPGLGTKPQIEIAKGQTEAEYPINANDKAQLGKWPVYAIGQANVDGPAWASSQLAELEIAEPFLTAELNRTTCEVGQQTSIFCQLNHHRPFPGEATAELLGVPPQIEIPSLTFTSETEQLIFQVKTSDKSPLGRHKGLFCRVTIQDQGEPIVSTVARSELQITKPKPVANDAVVATKAAPPATPQAKPKSRLQMLREAAQKKRDQ